MALAPLPRTSLAAQAAAALQTALQQGTWGEHLPGERELAGYLDVSRPTLRAALAQLEQSGWLAPAEGRSRRRVLAHSRPAPRAVRTIGLLSPLPLNEVPPFALCWMDHLREVLAAAGYQLETFWGRRWFTRPTRELAALVREIPAACWVLFTAPEKVQRWLAEHHVPCVLSGSAHEGLAIPSVDVDYRAVCRHAGGRLLARGHRRLALVLQQPLMAGDRESIAGFGEALARAKAATAVQIEHDGTPENIRRRVAASLARPEPPTGFIVGRSLPALAVATALAGAKLPRPAEIICRDSDRFLDFLTPRIAQYRHEPLRHARHLARAALQLAQGRPTAMVTRVMPRFVPAGTA